MLSAVKKHFIKADAEAIWAIWMLRLLSERLFKGIEDDYLPSAVSKMLPVLKLSKNSLTSLIGMVGSDQSASASAVKQSISMHQCVFGSTTFMASLINRLMV